MKQKQLAQDKFKIYIVLSSTSTKLGQLIQFVTKYKYNHVSLALGNKIDHMYSFARYSYNNPLVGGFIEESILRYYYDNVERVEVKVFEIPVTKENYEAVETFVHSLQMESQIYIYNTVSAIFHVFHRSFPIQKAYTCLDFIKEILKISQVDTAYRCERLGSIHQLDTILTDYCIFENDLMEIADCSDWGRDTYRFGVKRIYRVTSTINHFGSLLKRIVFS